ncbi:hypothetical protein [Jannaschia sp. CCS1]|uniref:hypothetical protein n=1 Tax=Jannaschia sp. (strain CCS1) TaxID=290400 RepID=UPI000053B1A1|nr:hypothetical protein [Jannaschia sp. CCS1]ABD54606.1 hypothetical protein Jann_1689 [Jannaschia sp. CCS1]
MRILGKNGSADAYRVSVDLGGDGVVALVPDALLSQQYGVDTKVSHDQAYEWIATQQHDLSDAIKALKKGATPRAPFTHITLE